MKWKRLGKIFDPTEHTLPNGCVSFAQSPQPLVLADRVRIFFSTRTRDATGKYLSHVAFVDFDKSFGTILGVAKEPVIPLGGLGTFDEHGIFPMNVLRDGNRILGYTTGWNRKKSVSNDAAIGLAVSMDEGLTFQRHGTGPVLSATLHEPFLVADAFVDKYDGVFHMWYIYGIRWIASRDGGQPDRVYKIGHATSGDGIAWRKEGRQLIADVLNNDECQALPTVVHFDNRYHMTFCFREAVGFRDQPAAGYRIGYASSDDLQTWTRNDDLFGLPIEPNAWDSDMQCYPYIFECGGKIYLLYNGNEFGRLGFGLAELEH